MKNYQSALSDCVETLMREPNNTKGNMYMYMYIHVNVYVDYNMYCLYICIAYLYLHVCLYSTCTWGQYCMYIVYVVQ